MKKMSTYGKGSEDAVSPVIGVILMVAITVILAAVIAAFVFGMAGNVSKTRSIAITAQKMGQAGSQKVLVTNNGGPDIGDVARFNVTINKADGTWLSGSTSDTVNITTTVGSSYAFAGDSNKDRVIVVSYFVDGTQQVVLDTQV